jgi:hypothetical protein
LHLTGGTIDWYATDWYVGRGSGIAAYVVLTFVVCVGLAMSGKAGFTQWQGFDGEEAHRFGARLVGGLVALHVLTIALHSHLALWPVLGIVAAALLGTVALVGRYRERIAPMLRWRADLVYVAVWAVATLHGLRTGTDRNATWLFVFYSASAAAVVALVLWRGLRPRGRVIVVGAIAAVLAVAFISALPSMASPSRHRAVAGSARR